MTKMDDSPILLGVLDGAYCWLREVEPGLLTLDNIPFLPGVSALVTTFRLCHGASPKSLR